MLSLDHHSVQDVLQIAEEIASENKFLDIHTIYQRARRKLKIPRKGLQKIIQFLIDNKLLVDGSRFTQESVLDNPNRNRLLDIIYNNLGIHFSALKRKFYSNKMGSTGQLVWHLEMLIKFNYIKKIDFKNYVIFVPIDLEKEHGIIYFLLRNSTNRYILLMFIDQYCVNNKEFYENSEKRRETIYYHLKELEKNGFIVFNDDGLVCIKKNLQKMLKKWFKSAQITAIKKEG